MPRKIAISMLELALITQDSNAKNTFDKTVEIAQLCEELDFKRIWLAEHHNMPHVASSATVVLISHLAHHTNSIRVGSGGIMLPNHSPLIIAEQFGTLATLFPNRIDLGLGRAPGTDGATAQAIRADFYEQSQQFPKNVSSLQQYFSVENASEKVRAFPAEGIQVPIWILGSSMDSAVLAAAYGLPYAFASHFAPQQMELAFEFYRDNFQPSEYLQQPKTMACVNFIGADTDEEARTLASSLYTMFLNLTRNNRQPLQPPCDGVFESMSDRERFQVNQMTSCTFVGSQKTIEKQLKTFINHLQIDELMITTPVYNHQAKLKSIRIAKSVLDAIS